MKKSCRLGYAMPFLMMALAVFIGSAAFAAGPLYVSPEGDNGNDGSLESPMKSITAAAALLSAGEEVRVLPGTYSVANTGEVFPIQPGSVRIVAYDPAGPIDRANHLISGGSAAAQLVNYTAGQSGYLADLTLGYTNDTPIVMQAASLTMDRCTVTGVTHSDIKTYSGKATAVQVYTGSTFTATDCAFTGTTGRGVIEGGGPGVIQEQDQAYVKAYSLHEKGANHDETDDGGVDCVCGGPAGGLAGGCP